VEGEGYGFVERQCARGGRRDQNITRLLLRRDIVDMISAVAQGNSFYA
jgi:hypothetical protein